MNFRVIFFLFILAITIIFGGYFQKSTVQIINQRSLLKKIDHLLDKKLDYYFHWRLPTFSSEHSSTIIHTNDGHRLYLDMREPFMALHILEHGEWETPLRRVLCKELKKGMVFIDVGANIGVHTLYATSLVGSSGRVIAVEPSPITREILRKNLEINGLLDRVQIVPFAISNKDDEITTFEYFKEHPAMSGLKVSELTLRQHNGSIERVEVKTLTIDGLVEKYQVIPDLIKIDVEGYERAVLQGCRRTIEKFPQVRFIVEYGRTMAEAVLNKGVGKEIAEFLGFYGFKVSRIDENQLCPMTLAQFSEDLGGDYIFSR